MFHTQTSISCGAYIQRIPHKHLSDLLNQSSSHSPKMNGLSNNSLFTMIQFMLFALSIPRVSASTQSSSAGKKQNKALYTLHLYFNIWLSMATAHSPFSSFCGCRRCTQLTQPRHVFSLLPSSHSLQTF